MKFITSLVKKKKEKKLHSFIFRVNKESFSCKKGKNKQEALLLALNTPQGFCGTC